jgi:hypothetical protein
MAKASRKQDFIFQRPGSANWYIKLRSPGEKRKEVSLGTADREQAVILSLPLIEEHKKKLLAARAASRKDMGAPTRAGLA